MSNDNHSVTSLIHPSGRQYTWWIQGSSQYTSVSIPWSRESPATTILLFFFESAGAVDLLGWALQSSCRSSSASCPPDFKNLKVVLQSPWWSDYTPSFASKYGYEGVLFTHILHRGVLLTIQSHCLLCLDGSHQGQCTNGWEMLSEASAFLAYSESLTPGCSGKIHTSCWLQTNPAQDVK